MLKQSALILSLAAVTGACAYKEAGEPLDTRYFGSATHENAAIISGDLSYTVQLANRFASEVPSTITFDFDSARLDESARLVLDQQAGWIKQFPEVRFKVFGHTDAVGSERYNKSLGLRRARAAVNYLVRHGISRKRLEAVVSFGETQPLVLTDQRERRNRRTVTEVSGFVQSRVNSLDGRYAEIIYRDYVESAVAERTLTHESAIEASLD
ncbi:Minor outer membrane protein Omp16 [Tritonibacter multivorans]|uniref:Minor outer membrane protein Omp16 n=1 Tax=Tritonibacter multivorans TaxID=928856 RepID=A0A0P1G1L5_9RHOB|nr:OmpA family protein [Tritonibacter multivorans]MDA7419473.1 OmpA family protein [Tritonibacter multivorans]CUH75535.1 Minor outer membrane protein Omp16 [Tritonibacter multivorans]SFC65839.1 Outer membrane protein OmpA [Tritonibacter multivorans]